MTALTFTKASKRQARLRMALVAPSGAGKTWTALAVALGYDPKTKKFVKANALGERVAVIDTERGSASKYADDPFPFEVLELESFSPETYIEAIETAAAADFDVLIIDSLSHAWMGKDGALELVDETTKKSQSSNSWASWREVTPMHNRLVDEIIGAPMHVIVTMRTRTEWVVEDDGNGRKVPKKIGMQPVQRKGLEYEFDVVADLDLQHNLIVSKTRCSALDDKMFAKPGADVGGLLKMWLSTGVPLASPEQHGELLAAIVALTDLDAEKDWRDIAEAAARRDHGHGTAELTETEMSALLVSLNEYAAKLREEAAPVEGEQTKLAAAS